MKNCSTLLPLLVSAGLATACGGPGVQPVDRTVATVEHIRGSIVVSGQPAASRSRVSPDGAIEVGEASLGSVRLDAGARVLLGAKTRVTVVTTQEVRFHDGRAYVQVAGGQQLTVVYEGGELRASNAAFSMEEASGNIAVYVIQGDVSYILDDVRGVSRAGERLNIAADGRTAVEPARLWHDWTGGLARPGLGEASTPTGVGSLEARIPEAIGQARWPLVARRLDVRVHIQGDYAVTEVDQVFFNPASETVEGIYRFHVPHEAVLQRFAVDRNGELVNGYVRERAQAQRSYEEQVYRGSTDDPALLVWDAPGSYRARIYPIAAGETRRILIRYAEWLSRPAAGAPRLYRYPMGGSGQPPHIQEFSMEVDIGDSGTHQVRAGMEAQVEGDSVMLRRSDFEPRADFWLELFDENRSNTARAYRGQHRPPPRAPGSRAIPNEADERDYFFLPLVLPPTLDRREATARSDSLDLVIVADISAATDRSRLELGRSVVESLTAHLKPADQVAIVTSDLTIRPVGGEEEVTLGPASAERLERLLDGLSRVPAGGATDLGAAITAASELLDPQRQGAVIYVGDGAPTVGELGSEGLLLRMARLPNPVRLYAIAVGASANLDLLSTLTRGGGLSLRVTDRSAAAEAALRVLAHASRPLARRVTVDLGPGIDNAFPRGPTGAQRGEDSFAIGPIDVVLGEVLPIVGRVRDDVPTRITVRGHIAGQEFTETLSVETSEMEDPTDLRLRWAGERLRQLLLLGEGREAVAELGTRCGLITPYTSYYVPSARELRESGHSSLFLRQPLLLEGDRARANSALASLSGVMALPLLLTGCSSDESPSDTVSSTTPPETVRPLLATEPPMETPPMTKAAPAATSQDSANEGGRGKRHRGEEGQMGRQDAQKSDNRFGIRGPADNPDPHMARERTRASSADDQGEQGILRTLEEAASPAQKQANSSPNTPEAAPPSPFGQDSSLGNDPEAALGALMGTEVGDSFGQAGLGLRGTGRGGGGTGEGTIGLGNLSTIGHGGGGGSGSGYGRGSGGLRGRRASVPRIQTGTAQVQGSLSKEVIRRYIRRHINQIRYCYEQQLSRNPDLAGEVALRFTISPSGAVSSASIARSSLGNPSCEQCISRAIQRIAFPQPEGGGVVTVTYPFQFQSADQGGRSSHSSPVAQRDPQPPPWVTTITRTTVTTTVTRWNEGHHRPKRCSDAARLSLDDRRALWRERLGSANSVSEWVAVYHQAIRRCETPTWREQQALLSLIVNRAASVSQMIQVHQALSGWAAQDYLRSAIFRRVRTPEDLRIVRTHFGVSSAVNWELIERILERAQNINQRIRILRQLLGLYPRSPDVQTTYPQSFELKLRLLSTLEEASRLTEARRLAHELRSDPLADAGVRTAVGEMYLRLGEEAEARRVFSEIVEFSPHDAAARRRLGDLYRAHGWFEEAYRQYETLASIRPDDPAVLLLLAQAAAGASRIDEALRLEQQLAETADPGSAGGLARVAILWSSVRFAKLRRAAREDNNTERLEALIRRMRRSGVLREAGQLRISLTWSHPDAGFSLWTAHPGLGLTRPTDISPEYGIEALDLQEAEAGRYTIEVRRQASDLRTPVEAELVIVFNEGRTDERILIESLRFEGDQRAVAWHLEGQALTPTQPSSEASGEVRR